MMQTKDVQGTKAGFTVRLSLSALCSTVTHRYNKSDRPEGGYLHQGFLTNKANSKMFQKLCSVDAGAAFLSLNVVFLFCTETVLAAPPDASVLKNKTTQKNS